jgi:hypothetical protein
MKHETLVNNLQLQPFSGKNNTEDCLFNVMLSKVGTVLQVVFEIDTQLRELRIPVFDPSKIQRKERLWEHTCFEIFIGKSDERNYWEFNLSPSGDWNVYSFSGYREGMKPESCFDKLPIKVKTLSWHEFRLETTIDLRFFVDFSDVDVGLSAVLEWKDGVKSYWAVSHQGECPDFHARGGWLKSL